MTRYDFVYCDAGHSVLSGFNFLVIRFGTIWKVQERNTMKYLTRSAAFFAIGAGVTCACCRRSRRIRPSYQNRRGPGCGGSSIPPAAQNLPQMK
jgi:hypothetical protein